MPELRFPEFLGADDWGISRLGELGKTVPGLTYAPSDVRDAGLLVLRSSNVLNGVISLDDCVYVAADISGANPTRSRDILICVRNGSNSLIGKSAIVPENMPPCTHGAFMTVFRAQNPEFVYQLFRTKEYQDQVAADLGARINSINSGQLVKYKFAVPTPPEQKRIADCLSSIDNLVATQIKRIESLKTHRKGLAQQLFPSEGEAVPRLRFPQFRTEKVWKKMRIGKFMREAIRPIEMSNTEIYSLVTVRRRYSGVESRGTFSGASIKVKSQYLIKENDFLISNRQIVHCACGVVPRELEDSIVSNEYSVLEATPECDVKFFRYFAQQPRVSESFLSSSRGIVIEKMLFDLGYWLNREFLFPSLSEQRKIGNFLHSIDYLIDSHIGKLEALRTLKSGLMQGMFPSTLEGRA